MRVHYGLALTLFLVKIPQPLSCKFHLLLMVILDIAADRFKVMVIHVSKVFSGKLLTEFGTPLYLLYAEQV